MRNLHHALRLLAATLLVCESRAAFDYSVSFDSGISEPNFFVYGLTNWQSAPPGSGLGAAAIGGRLQLYKNDGLPNGAIRYTSTFCVTGDFAVTVECDRSILGNGKSGLLVSFVPAGWIDCFFHWMGRASAVVYFPGGSTEQRTITDATAQGVLRIRREGATLYSEVDFGNGFVGVITNSNPEWAAPARVVVFLNQEDNYPAANYALFDNLSVHADGGLCPLSAQPGTNAVVVSWPHAGSLCILEGTPTLSPVPAWETVTNVPALNGWYDILTMGPAEPARFFRLRWQSYY